MSVYGYGVRGVINYCAIWYYGPEGFQCTSWFWFFLLIVFRARLRRVWSIIVVLSPVWNLNLDGIIVPFWEGNSGALSDSEVSDAWESYDWDS